MMSRNLVVLALLAAVASCCPDEANCLGCNNERNMCRYCENGWLNTETIRCDTRVTRKIDFCKEYLKGDPSVCIACDFGHDVGTNAKGESVCIPCDVQNCAQCVGKTQVCTACFAPHLLFKDTDGVTRCKPFKDQPFPGCRVSANWENDAPAQEKCLQCASHKMLTQAGKCVDDKFGDCWFGEENESACRTCTYGHYVTKDGKCQLNRFAPEEVKRYWMKVLLIGFVVLVLLAVASYFYCARKRSNAVGLAQPIMAN